MSGARLAADVVLSLLPAEHTALPTGLPLRRAEVHQATGVLSVQLGIGKAEALVRLGAHAFAERRPVTDVARDVVTRRLRPTPRARPDPA